MNHDRLFGLILTFILLIILLYQLLMYEVISSNLSIAIIITFAISLFFPSTLKIPRKIWEFFGRFLHKFTNPIILSFIFFIVFFPVGIIVRFTKLSTFQKGYDKKKKSYWESVNKQFDEEEFNNPY